MEKEQEQTPTGSLILFPNSQGTCTYGLSDIKGGKRKSSPVNHSSDRTRLKASLHKVPNVLPDQHTNSESTVRRCFDADRHFTLAKPWFISCTLRTAKTCDSLSVVQERPRYPCLESKAAHKPNPKLSGDFVQWHITDPAEKTSIISYGPPCGTKILLELTASLAITALSSCGSSRLTLHGANPYQSRLPL